MTADFLVKWGVKHKNPEICHVLDYRTILLLRLEFKSINIWSATEILTPMNTWLQKGAYVSKAIQLAHSFHINFDKFASQASEEIMNGGPLIDSHHSLTEHL